MKRKRGSKTGPKKGKKDVVNNPASAPVSVSTQDNSDKNDDHPTDYEMDVNPPHVGPDKPSNMPNFEADLPDDRITGKRGPGRVKVKLRSSRVLEPHRNHSGEQIPSEPALEMIGMAVEKEDNICSDGQTSGLQSTLPEKMPRKAGSIKIKSSMGLGFSSHVVQDKNLNKLDTHQMPCEGNSALSENEKAADLSIPRNSCQRETKVAYRDPRYNEKELGDALVVIKKVMKMDAAGPFNAPVNPVALGIPDYFDVIDNPMDFGTICHDLEHSSKYMNSENVYKDVQFIWENCYRYNNKGDYIIDLMKRVKKNFMKYWMAAGLYSDMRGDTDSTRIGDASQNEYPKSKSKHKRRRYGIDRHKSDCMCAVCVVRRRRKERDGSQIFVGDANLTQEFKLEETSPLNNPYSEDATSSLDRSQETDANADAGEAENEDKLETRVSAQAEQRDILDNEMETSEKKVPPEDGTPEDSRQQSREEEMDLEETAQEESLPYDQQMESKRGESSERSKRFKLQENNLLRENQSILQICRSLFPRDHRSPWNGPHSLCQRRPSGHNSSIHAVVAAFMKQ